MDNKQPTSSSSNGEAATLGNSLPTRPMKYIGSVRVSASYSRTTEPSNPDSFGTALASQSSANIGSITSGLPDQPGTSVGASFPADNSTFVAWKTNFPCTVC